jgi:Xaa-Pro aminopeptidase
MSELLLLHCQALVCRRPKIGSHVDGFPLAYLLNLRGFDIPFNPLFHSYLFISLDRVILFLATAKLTDDTEDYLRSLKVERREYNDIWTFLRRREWGEGRLLLCPETSDAISLMLTHFRYTVVPSHVDNMKAVRNEVELEGLQRAYLRDGAAYVCPVSASPV